MSDHLGPHLDGSHHSRHDTSNGLDLGDADAPDSGGGGGDDYFGILSLYCVVGFLPFYFTTPTLNGLWEKIGAFIFTKSFYIVPLFIAYSTIEINYKSFWQKASSYTKQTNNSKPHARINLIFFYSALTMFLLGFSPLVNSQIPGFSKAFTSPDPMVRVYLQFGYADTVLGFVLLPTVAFLFYVATLIRRQFLKNKLRL